MDPLDYSEEQLRNLDIETLEKLAIEAENLENTYKTQQLVEKLLINSLYGALANKHFPLFNEDIAAAITGNGRYYIRKMSNYIEAKLQELFPWDDNYIIYNDTDSAYYTIKPFVDHYKNSNPNANLEDLINFADNFEKKVIQPIIQKSIDDFAEELNAYNKDAIGCEREIISDCLAPNSNIKILQDGRIKNQTISTFARDNGIEIRRKEGEYLNISDKNIQILSYNEKTNKNELKRILNIQKKITTKQMVQLETPDGKKLNCTEDHKIAIKQKDGIIYKMAKDILETDYVLIYDSIFYTKENCILYEQEYINYGSKNTDLKQKGKNISSSRKINHQKRLEIKNKKFNERIDNLIEKYNSKYFKFIFRFLDVRKTKNISKEDIINFLKTYISVKKLNLDIFLIEQLVLKKTSRKKFIKKYKMKKKYGKSFYRKMNNGAKIKKNGFKNMLDRATVIQRKYNRSKGPTPLHTAKKNYRREVDKYNKRSLKQNELKNRHLVDKYNYNIDHIVPTMYGFWNNIPPELIGNIRNMRVIPKIDNIKKRCNIDYSAVDYELFKGYI